MWLLLDKQDPEQDRRLAQHILGVHQGVVNKVCNLPWWARGF
jgi:DNA replicative helicase MCM subunit Mcm2 (Cdc46/Mcm family)